MLARPMQSWSNMEQPVYPPEPQRLSCAPLHWLSAVLIIAFDWTILALNLNLLSYRWRWIAAALSLVAGFCVGGIEHWRARSGSGLAAAKAAIAAFVIAMPLPFAGSAVGAIALLWCLADALRKRSSTGRAPDEGTCSQLDSWFSRQ